MITEIIDYKKSKVLIGERLANVTKYIPKGTQSVVLITDINVKRIYGREFPNYPVITIQTGEKIKTQETIDSIIEQMLSLGADRHTFIIGIGGGIVCDISGFVASIYMRGILFGYVSTTLLSQVDASIGGKTGINFRGYKNTIGVFNHPQFVLCDVTLLKSLSEKEIKNGLIEIVKHAIINDANEFSFIENNLEKILSIDIPTLKQLITRSIKIKATIVTQDEREKDERKKLNLGHTVGHAIESIAGLPHGYAVAIGLVITVKISHLSGFCSHKTVSKITNLITTLQLSTKTDIKTNRLIEVIQKDKKKRMNTVDFIAIKSIGNVVINPISFLELEQNIEAVR